MACAKCGRTSHALIGNLCPSCHLSSPPAGLGLDPIFPGDIVEVVKEDDNQGMRGSVIKCSAGWQPVDVWVCLKPDRESEPYYASYSRDDVKLFSRYRAS